MKTNDPETTLEYWPWKRTLETTLETTLEMDPGEDSGTNDPEDDLDTDDNIESYNPTPRFAWHEISIMKTNEKMLYLSMDPLEFLESLESVEKDEENLVLSDIWQKPAL